jgi:tetratricopeptide (TPR) repeat protein
VSSQVFKYEKALADFNYAIKLNSRFVATYYNRALTNYDLMEYEKAIADFNAVLALEPNLPSAYCGRGNAYHKMGNYPQAVSDYNSACIQPGKTIREKLDQSGPSLEYICET